MTDDLILPLPERFKPIRNKVKTFQNVNFKGICIFLLKKWYFFIFFWKYSKIWQNPLKGEVTVFLWLRAKHHFSVYLLQSNIVLAPKSSANLSERFQKRLGTLKKWFSDLRLMVSLHFWYDFPRKFQKKSRIYFWRWKLDQNSKIHVRFSKIKNSKIK